MFLKFWMIFAKSLSFVYDEIFHKYETALVYMRKGPKWKISFIWLPKFSILIICFLHQTVFPQSSRKEFSLSFLLFPFFSKWMIAICCTFPYVTCSVFHSSHLCIYTINVQVLPISSSSCKREIKNPQSFVNTRKKSTRKNSHKKLFFAMKKIRWKNGLQKSVFTFVCSEGKLFLILLLLYSKVVDRMFTFNILYRWTINSDELREKINSPTELKNFSFITFFCNFAFFIKNAMHYFCFYLFRYPPWLVILFVANFYTFVWFNEKLK